MTESFPKLDYYNTITRFFLILLFIFHLCLSSLAYNNNNNNNNNNNSDDDDDDNGNDNNWRLLSKWQLQGLLKQRENVKILYLRYFNWQIPVFIRLIRKITKLQKYICGTTMSRNDLVWCFYFKKMYKITVKTN